MAKKKVEKKRERRKNFKYRLHHDEEIGMGFTQPRVRGLKIV